MSVQAQRETFRASYRQALTNSNLRQTLSKATAQFVAARKNAASDLGQEEWERLRNNARQIKDHTLARLDYYLEQFSTNVERLGGHVHWAASAAEANRYIAGIAAARHVRLVVKSKSMVTEEIELNRALADVGGIETVETDLGEYIIQLADERPSHMIAPAIHKSRRDVASLFSERLKLDCPDEIDGIAAVARRVLRERFAIAGIGITGVNFAVAETGTLVLVENEGNIRMATSLPPVHIAVMGIEKLVPRLVDLEPFLRLLPRSASGQKATSYVSLLTGVKSAREEGPEELHVVILDNGRTEMLARPHLREALNCIRCGACLNVCPVYQTIGGHAYGSVYSGPIGAVLTLPMAGGERAAELPFASTLCGACRDACPVKLDIPKMLVQVRREVVEPSRTKVQPYARERLKNRMALLGQHLIFMVWARMMSARHRYRRAAWVVRFVQRWRRMSAVPSFAQRSFREQWRTGSVPPAVAGGSTIGITRSRDLSTER